MHWIRWRMGDHNLLCMLIGAIKVSTTSSLALLINHLTAVISHSLEESCCSSQCTVLRKGQIEVRVLICAVKSYNPLSLPVPVRIVAKSCEQSGGFPPQYEGYVAPEETNRYRIDPRYLGTGRLKVTVSP
jgi:hypothetical protein